MRYALLAGSLLGLAAAQTGKLGDAYVTTNNPPNTLYQATLLDKPNTDIRGTVTVRGAPDGRGIYYDVDMSGFPSTGGPFLYHVHASSVPADGNCTGTLAHLDPFQRGEVPGCNSSAPQTCEAGDLSGKYGRIPGPGNFKANYLDLYTTNVPGLGSFVGNLSIVVHWANRTRVNCGNFTLLRGGRPMPTGVMPTGVMPTGGMRPSQTPYPPMFPGAGSRLSSAFSTVGVVAVVAGLLL
ncbi:Cell surface superoxide dismutase [Cu-Zn] 4 [Ophidiomyces ophidiicola]|nr:Cell surface superoxide dismutase [Cu-Zn] 4 [Ophidiomyces ophidiicola]KAI1982695.1 Cell surface superoxide dismutase [Cu-Zn] 4 [Ophidiomyces ophidiicola]KAI1987398.1 Cell surface superoxide dismutase [Cu-Zn] 4 [Ophidiomyces ophidiicola]KAI1995481.1 Cell surface superoxide dismutase [Cu-Zn] 4 [Ophidiomyces ophidiicola]